MIGNILALTSTNWQEHCIEHCLTTDLIAECDGTSLWMNTYLMVVHIDRIRIRHQALDDRIITEILVEHNGPWEIYTDRGFEQSVSEFLGFAVRFTEQGLQEPGLASLEPAK